MIVQTPLQLVANLPHDREFDTVITKSNTQIEDQSPWIEKPEGERSRLPANDRNSCRSAGACRNSCS